MGFSLYQGVVGGRGKTFLTDPAPGVSPNPQPSEIELCLKESEASGSQSILFSILIGLRSITFLKAQLDSDLPEAASGIRRRLCSPVPRLRQLRAAPGCAGLRIRALRGCLGRPPWTLVGSPKWFCFRYLVRVFFLSHKLKICSDKTNLENLGSEVVLLGSE